MSDSEVHGIAKSDFQAWRHHPVSKVFFKFLADRRGVLSDTALQLWITGEMPLATDQTIRGQIIELFEIENMEFDTLVTFYRETDETETNQDESR